MGIVEVVFDKERQVIRVAAGIQNGAEFFVAHGVAERGAAGGGGVAGCGIRHPRISYNKTQGAANGLLEFIGTRAGMDRQRLLVSSGFSPPIRGASDCGT